MRFFTDQFFSETQKTKLLENSHLLEHPSVGLADQGTQSTRPEPMFYMEWQQDHMEKADAALEEGMNESSAPVTDLSAVMVMMLVGVFGGLFVFDVLLG